MGLIEAILYGIVQGITEWLPISSTAHLRLLPEVLHGRDPGAGFTAVIQLGTILAVLIYFRTDLWGAIRGWARAVAGKDKDSLEAKVGWGVFYGTLPIVLIGFALRHQISSDSIRSLYVISGTLIVMGVVMLIAERLGKRDRGFEAITVKDGIVVGLWQALALLPGMSRSGSTISGGLFAGFDRQTAARFSFLLSVPSIIAAGLFEILNERKQLLDAGLTNVAVATVVSFAVGYASIAFLMKYLQKNGIGIFIGYRIGLGILLLILLQQGILHPVSQLPVSP